MIHYNLRVKLSDSEAFLLLVFEEVTIVLRPTKLDMATCVIKRNCAWSDDLRGIHLKDGQMLFEYFSLSQSKTKFPLPKLQFTLKRLKRIHYMKINQRPLSIHTLIR